MANVLIEQNTMADIADAIRGKNGSVSTYTPAQMVTAITNIRGGGFEYETGTWTPASVTTRGTISFSNTHTKPPALYIIMDSTENLTIPSSTILYNSFIDVYQILGLYMPRSSATYAVASYVYKGSSSVSQGTAFCDYPYTDSTDQSAFFTRYWATETEFHPYSNSSARYWQPERTYKWIAIWV